jgi:hypothetical protein
LKTPAAVTARPTNPTSAITRKVKPKSNIMNESNRAITVGVS